MKKLILSILLVVVSLQFTYGQQIFENKEYGFQMQKPEHWMEASNQELLKNLEKFEVTEENLSKLIANNKGSILLSSFYKYNPKNHSGIIPTIQINVRSKGNTNFENFKKVIIESAKGFEKYFTDFQYIKEPMEIEISGIKSVYIISKFTMKAQNGKTLNVRSRTYAIPYKNYFFQVNFTDGPIEEDCNAIFDELVKTIKIK